MGYFYSAQTTRASELCRENFICCSESFVFAQCVIAGSDVCTEIDLRSSEHVTNSKYVKAREQQSALRRA